MNFFEISALGLILILFPLYVYLFYLFYNVDIGKKDNDILLDMALFSSFYLAFRYIPIFNENGPIFMFNIVILLAYIKKRNITALLLSLCSIVYYYGTFQFSIPLLLMEYTILFLLAILYDREVLKNKMFNFLFVAIQLFFIFYYLYFSNVYHIDIPMQCLLKSLSEGFIFLLTCQGSKFLFESGESIIRYHHNVKDLKEEKKVRDSLFKITHEIKNPIAVCKGYLDMLNTDNVEQSQKYIPIIRKEIASTLLLLEDFLYMNKIKIQKEEMDIGLLLEDVEGHFKLLLHEKKIASKFDKIEDEVYIIGDYNRLMQVLINMVKNSMEALEGIENGLVKMCAKIENENIKLIIEDNGCGITEKDMQRIKEPFYSTKRRGTGLGVSLSDEIVSAHGGQLEYSSKWGEGTTVTITLPIHELVY
ncbi:MAG: HAMP domain-containing sensor histidine kinase [Bacilli bacterium]|nr:HAMP domain-containing sensor histidine kinase [Bacilli bacterium]